MAKERVDLLLVQRGLCESREQAARSIMAGLVYTEEKRIDKPGTRVGTEVPLELRRQLHPYVSRGGLKLEKALKVFNRNVNGAIGLDIGASTGGFTDCLLQHGAQLVYAVEIGYAQLAWKLRQDKRVIAMERCNFLQLSAQQLTFGLPNVVVLDLSFVSVCKMFEHVKSLLAPQGFSIVLIKPQFEAGRSEIGKRGVVKCPEVHKTVLEKVLNIARVAKLACSAIDYSPIRGGRRGNIEFIALFFHAEESNFWPVLDIEQTVCEAHRYFSK
ncbi:MAG: hypothetical protein RLZ12_931 [Bacillota bacterium]